MSESSARPDPDALLASIHREDDAGAARTAEDFLRDVPRRGQNLRDAAGRAAAAGGRAWKWWSASWKRTGARKRRRCSKGLTIVPRMQGRASRARRSKRSTSMPSCSGIRSSASSMNSRTPTRRASRHPKRYQDVLELLDAGIDVFTTVNVQHIESRARHRAADHRRSRCAKRCRTRCSIWRTRSS